MGWRKVFATLKGFNLLPHPNAQQMATWDECGTRRTCLIAIEIMCPPTI
jgi:hypothetical protein